MLAAVPIFVIRPCGADALYAHLNHSTYTY